MTIILATLAIFIICVALNHYLGPYNDASIFSFIGACGSGLALACMLVTIPINRMEVLAHLAEFRAVEYSRADVDDLESATYRVQIAEANAWLASTQYYNKSAFELWIPDEIDSVKPIRSARDSK